MLFLEMQVHSVKRSFPVCAAASGDGFTTGLGLPSFALHPFFVLTSASVPHEHLRAGQICCAAGDVLFCRENPAALPKGTLPIGGDKQLLGRACAIDKDLGEY